MAITLSELAARCGAELSGDGDTAIAGVASAGNAAQGDITFVNESRYLESAKHSQASAVIARRGDVEAIGLPALVHDNPYLIYARVSRYFNPRPQPAPGVDDSAMVSPEARVDGAASIGPGCIIEAGAVVAAGTVLSAQCVVESNAVIGERCWLGSGVVVAHSCILGSEVVVQPGAVIGSDGFGFARGEAGWEAIPQIGRVVIGDGVHIGANTCIDRGALDDTVIEEGVILDNLIQIAHNVRIGHHTAVAAMTGMAGSTRIGANCTVGGMAKFTGHLSIPDDTHIAADTLISGTIHQAGAYAGGIPYDKMGQWRKNAVRFKQLDTLHKRVRELEQTLARLTQNNEEDNND